MLGYIIIEYIFNALFCINSLFTMYFLVQIVQFGFEQNKLKYETK